MVASRARLLCSDATTISHGSNEYKNESLWTVKLICISYEELYIVSSPERENCESDPWIDTVSVYGFAFDGTEAGMGRAR